MEKMIEKLEQDIVWQKRHIDALKLKLDDLSKNITTIEIDIEDARQLLNQMESAHDLLNAKTVEQDIIIDKVQDIQ